MRRIQIDEGGGGRARRSVSRNMRNEGGRLKGRKENVIASGRETVAWYLRAKRGDRSAWRLCRGFSEPTSLANDQTRAVCETCAHPLSQQ